MSICVHIDMYIHIHRYRPKQRSPGASATFDLRHQRSAARSAAEGAATLQGDAADVAAAGEVQHQPWYI